MWAQWDWGAGPVIAGRRTSLFCAWLAWSRFRVVVPCWDRRLATVIACVDRAMRAFGGAPTYWSNRQPPAAAMGCGRVSRLLTAVVCVMAMGIVGLVSACGGHSGDGADPVKSLSAPASEIADDLDEAAADVGDSSLDAIADGLSATGDGEPIIDQIRRRNAG